MVAEVKETHEPTCENSVFPSSSLNSNLIPTVSCHLGVGSAEVCFSHRIFIGTLATAFRARCPFLSPS
jgi:hypothetical protein